MELELKRFVKDLNNKLEIVKCVVSDEIFGYPFKPVLIHQIISSYLTNDRQGTKAQKSRGEVTGSNKKPWRQKGTGRARAGSSKSPIWRSGGVTFAAKPKLYYHKMNKKMYRGAIKSILSRLVCENRLFLIEGLVIERPKSKFLLELLQKIIGTKSVLIVTDNLDKNLVLAARNLYKVEVRNLDHIDPVSLVKYNITLLNHRILSNIENRLV